MNRQNCQVLLWKWWASELLIEIDDVIRRRNVMGEKDNQLLFGLFKTAAGMFWKETPQSILGRISMQEVRVMGMDRSGRVLQCVCVCVIHEHPYLRLPKDSHLMSI